MKKLNINTEYETKHTEFSKANVTQFEQEKLPYFTMTHPHTHDDKKHVHTVHVHPKTGVVMKLRLRKQPKKYVCDQSRKMTAISRALGDNDETIACCQSLCSSLSSDITVISPQQGHADTFVVEILVTVRMRKLRFSNRRV